MDVLFNAICSSIHTALFSTHVPTSVVTISRQRLASDLVAVLSIDSGAQVKMA